jgi:hypothetical protein
MLATARRPPLPANINRKSSGERNGNHVMGKAGETRIDEQRRFF